MPNRFPLAGDAARHVLEAIKEVLADGYTVTGIDPAKVIFRVDDPGAAGAVAATGSRPPSDFAAKLAEPHRAPFEKLPVAPYQENKHVDLHAAGFTGDLSHCCGAPLRPAGTCHVCTSCGNTTGCG